MCRDQRDIRGCQDHQVFLAPKVPQVSRARLDGTDRKENRGRLDQSVHQDPQANPGFLDKTENKARWDAQVPRVSPVQLARKETEEFRVQPEVVDYQGHRVTQVLQDPRDLPVQLVQWVKQVRWDPQGYPENRD